MVVIFNSFITKDQYKWVVKNIRRTQQIIITAHRKFFVKL